MSCSIEELPGWSFFNAKVQYCIQAAQDTKQAAQSGQQVKVPGPKQNAGPQKCIVEVLPGLFLGSREAEQDLQLLQDKAITYILQVAYEVLPSHAGLNRFVYKHVPVYDMEAEDLVNTFEGSFAFIHGALQAGHKVLCHCLAGNSRSAATVLAYMMWHKHVGLSRAMAQLKGLRPSVNPNAGFRLQLEWFEDAGCPNPPLDWQGWDLGTFLQRHNAGHRNRQERFKQQQEAHKQRVQQRKEQKQQQQQQEQQQHPALSGLDTQQKSLAVDIATSAATSEQQQQQVEYADSPSCSAPNTPFSTASHSVLTPAAVADTDSMPPSPYASASPAVLSCGNSPKALLGGPRSKGSPDDPCHMLSAFVRQHDHNTAAAKQSPPPLQQQQQQQGQQQWLQSLSSTDQELDFAIRSDPDFTLISGNRLPFPSEPGSYPSPSSTSRPSLEARSWSHFQQQQQQQQDFPHGALSSPLLCIHPSAASTSDNPHPSATVNSPSPSTYNIRPPFTATANPPVQLPASCSAAAEDGPMEHSATHHDHHPATACMPATAAASMPARGADVAPTPRGSANGVAEGQEDCFRTPERARHGGALRLLLRRKPSLNMATPGSPSSPHLDATPNRVEKGHRGSGSQPFHSPRPSSTLTPNRPAPGTSSLLSCPFLARLPQPSSPPTQAACLDADHECSEPEEQQQQQEAQQLAPHESLQQQQQLQRQQQVQQQPLPEQCDPHSFFAPNVFELDEDVFSRQAAPGTATQSAGPPGSVPFLSGANRASPHRAPQQDICLDGGQSSPLAEARKDPSTQAKLSRHAYSMPYNLCDTHIQSHTHSTPMSPPLSPNRRCSAPGVNATVPECAPQRTEQGVGGSPGVDLLTVGAQIPDCALQQSGHDAAPAASNRPSRLLHLGSSLEEGAGFLNQAMEEAAQSWRSAAQEAPASCPQLHLAPSPASSPQLYLAPPPQALPPRSVSLLSPHASGSHQPPPHISIPHLLPPHDIPPDPLQQQQQQQQQQYPYPPSPTAKATALDTQHKQQHVHKHANCHNHQQQSPYQVVPPALPPLSAAFSSAAGAAAGCGTVVARVEPAMPACTVSPPSPHSAGANDAAVVDSLAGKEVANVVEPAMPPPLAALTCSAAGTAAGAAAGHGSSGRRSTDAVQGGRPGLSAPSAGAANAVPAAAGYDGSRPETSDFWGRRASSIRAKGPGRFISETKQGSSAPQGPAAASAGAADAAGADVAPAGGPDGGRGGADNVSSATRQSSGDSSNSAAAGKKLSLTDSVLLSMHHSVSESALAMVGEASGEEGGHSEVEEALGRAEVWDLEPSPPRHFGRDIRSSAGSHSCDTNRAAPSTHRFSAPQISPFSATRLGAAAHGASASSPLTRSSAAAQGSSAGTHSDAAAPHVASNIFSFDGKEQHPMHQHAGHAGVLFTAQQGSAPMAKPSTRPTRHSYCGME